MKNITIAGRVARDGKLQQAGNQPVLGFALAVDNRVKVNGAWEKKTIFFDCSLWGRRGESMAEILTKGTAVCVSGDFGLREYKKRTGEPATAPTVNVSEVTLLGNSSSGSGGYPGPPPAHPGGQYAGQGTRQPTDPLTAPTSAPMAATDDDIPF